MDFAAKCGPEPSDEESIGTLSATSSNIDTNPAMNKQISLTPFATPTASPRHLFSKARSLTEEALPSPRPPMAPTSDPPLPFASIGRLELKRGGSRTDLGTNSRSTPILSPLIKPTRRWTLNPRDVHCDLGGLDDLDLDSGFLPPIVANNFLPPIAANKFLPPIVGFVATPRLANRL